MNEKAKAMVLASFVGDALALGVHWIYNTHVIDKKWGRVETYMKPEKPTYHPTKDLGEFTHYGDQALVLLRSTSEKKGFDLEHFAKAWQSLFASYDGYFDEAIKGTLQNISEGKDVRSAGSPSLDLAGAARIAPIVYRYRNDLNELIASARAQTAFTHNTELVIECAEFFGRVAFKVLGGEAPTSAIRSTMAEGFQKEPYERWIEDGLESIGMDTRQATLDFGQMCEVEAAFPSVIHLIGKYENDLRAGLIENAMAGGDSAGRGLMMGMILGAHLGMDAIPEAWLKDLKAYQEVMELLGKME
ncbi:MAG: ADP-ribosylglycohydrolase family protein [Desulfatiglandaceae bacterium]|jgi:ADP-ribosylglycohydrolase